MIRFIHCADLHFDRPFEGLSVIEQNQTNLVEYNQQTLKNIVDHAIKSDVDFVLFAGDTFHQNKPTLKTQRLFFEQMTRLEQKAIPVYLCFGNHDYYDETRYWFEFPENVHLYKEERVETIEGVTKDNERYAISAFSYNHPWIEESKVAEFPGRKSIDYHLGMYHGEIGSKHYAAFQPSEMSRKGYDYWALGHIHVSTTVQLNPPIIYPGTPMGHTKKEIQTKGIALVTLEKKGQPLIEYIDVAAVLWKTKEISLKKLRTLREIVPTLKSFIRELSFEQPTFLKIVVVDTDNLPNNWLTKTEKKELLAILNDRSQLTQQWVYEIEEISTRKSEMDVFIQCDETELAHIQTHYQMNDIFHEALSELWTQPVLNHLLTSESFKKEVMEQVTSRLTSEITIRGGE